MDLPASRTLAAHAQALGDTEAAVETLRPIYEQLTEGFGTADTIEAANLLGSLGSLGGVASRPPV